MKHNVLSADARTKFIVIASASRSNLSAGENMMRNAQAQHHVLSMSHCAVAVESVTGFYRENIAQEGSYEQSIAIALNTSTALRAVTRLFCDIYEQDCILVWNRDTDSVWLMNEDGMSEIGKHGMRITWSSLHVAEANNWIQPDAYTIAADGSVWEVR